MKVTAPSELLNFRNVTNRSNTLSEVGERKKTQDMLKEFKAFVMKGNVLDLAVAVIIGAAFGAIVTSMVNDIIMPPVGMILGHIDFKELFISLNGQAYPTQIG